MWPALVLQHLQTWPLCPESPHSSCLGPSSASPYPSFLLAADFLPGLWFWCSGFGTGLLHGSQQLVCYLPAPAEIPADSQHGMEAQQRPPYLQFSPWLFLCISGRSCLRCHRDKCLQKRASWAACCSWHPSVQGRENASSQLGCPPVQPFKGLHSRRTLIWGSPTWDFSSPGTRSVTPEMCARLCTQAVPSW